MKINEVLEEIERYYKEDIFRPLTEAEIDEVHEKYPGFIDRVSASMGRHLAKVIREKIEPEQKWRERYRDRLVSLGAHRGEAIEIAEAVEYDEDEDPEESAEYDFELWEEDSE